MTEANVQKDIFDVEIARLPQDLQKKLRDKREFLQPLMNSIEESARGKVMGFYISPTIEMKNKVPTPNFDKLSFQFLLDDFEKPVQFFDPKLLLGKDYEKFLVEERKRDQYNQEYSVYFLKEDKNIEFVGITISILRENCFDGIYDDLKSLGSCFVIKDTRGFISALKTIDIHRNMLLQKFEKYVVVYAGAGSWLRGEKSNDFDVFVVVDDTDVKRMPRMQVKDQLLRIIWQMAKEVAQLTGIQIHTQVYLLTDFWDALKDAHPVMFTFLRDGVPFYDRGIYSAWKELLKLGKIKPSPEAIDMHMNVGNQLIDRAKKTFQDIMMNDIYLAVLNPAQAVLMMKGYNPTTPRETVKIFKEVLLEKEKVVSAKDAKTLEDSVALMKKIEHDREYEVKGSEIDKYLKNAEDFLKNVKKMFEQITEEKTKDSVISTYQELLNQMRAFPGYSELEEDTLLKRFENEYISSGKLPTFVKTSLRDTVKAKKDHEKGKLSLTEVNKVLKEARNVLKEIKEYRNKASLSEIQSRKLQIKYDERGVAEILNYENKNYLVDLTSEMVFEFVSGTFKESKKKREDLVDVEKISALSLNDKLFAEAKKILKAKEVHL